MFQSWLFIAEIQICIKLFIFFLIINLFIILISYFFYKLNIFNNNVEVFKENSIKNNIFLLISITSIYIGIITIFLNISFYSLFFLQKTIFISKIYYMIIETNFFNNNNTLFIFSLNKFNIIFIILFSVLFPIIFSIMSYDYNNINIKIYIYIYIIFLLSYLLLLTENLILFYFIYELILIFVFFSMYLTSNSRGGIEASLFFAAWAVLGSILVGLGIMYLTVINNYVFFYQVKLNKLTSNEIYYIYIFFFLGFGVKLSVWPFWYWLPKAHVEVSTGMSIYLSCILIKLSFFCLLRFQFVLLSEIPHLVCVFFSLICCFDITFRFINLKDLKAIIAYGSVLHTNLLLALIHLDSFQIFKASIYYIWGHSLATASLFIIINIIEVNYSSRSILFISGIWNSSPKLFYLIIMSLLSFLDIPVTVFFWGEIWLWIITSNQLWLVFIQVLFLVNVIFTSIFFKIWWCILFGTMDISDKKKSSINLNSELYIQLIILVILQIIFGIQPSILSYITGFYF